MKIISVFRSIKNGSFRDKIKEKIYFTPFYKLYNIISPFEKIEDNKIILCAGGDAYGGDPKYIAEYILEHNLDYHIVWLIDKQRCKNLQSFPQKIEIVELFTLRSLHEYSTARIWIDNSRKIYYPKKKKNQIYIQTWHGNFPFKKIEKDAVLPPAYIKIAKNDSKAIDYILSGNKEETKLYKESFWYNGKVLEIGTPNCDVMFSKSKINAMTKSVHEFYGIDSDTRILMYAPTFRNNGDLSVYNLDYERLYQSLKKRFGGKWQILTRLHPNLIALGDKIKLPSTVINATAYPDMRELQCASDIALTDLSGWIFEYFLMNRPVFFYMTDAEEYFKYDRGLYFKPMDTPFPFAKNDDELNSNILNFDNEQYQHDIEQFRNKYGFCVDGKSCENTIKLIENLIK